MDNVEASRLGAEHIGKTIHLAIGDAEAKDVLVGVKQHGGNIPWTTLQLQHLGAVECSLHQIVLIAA